MYKELVEKLRHRGTLYNGISLFDDAADAIEKLLFKYNFANMTKKETDITLKNEFLKCLRLEAENKHRLSFAFQGAASGKEEGKFSALLAPRQPDWVASQGCRKSQLRSKAVGLG